MTMESIAIFIAMMACIFIQRFWYIAKMHRIGAAVIGEAYRVHESWPDEYPNYYTHAMDSLNDHGCADLVQHLPQPLGDLNVRP